MGVRQELLKKMRDDVHVLALIAATDEAPFTAHTIEAVGRWFDDVEIKFPISDMGFSDAERRGIIRDVAGDLLGVFNAAVDDCVEGELDDERFAKLAAAVDPLWRELAGALATQLNELFEERRVPAEHSYDFAQMMISKMREEHGDEAVIEFRKALVSDSNLRAQMRRIGIDPDAI